MHTTLPQRITRALANAVNRRYVDGRDPDFIVGLDDPAGPYLLRWYITPWRRWQTAVRERATARPTRWNRAIAGAANLLPNLYAHVFLRDDDDRALHDHPSWACSLILEGGYIEHTIAAGGIHHRRTWSAGSLRLLPTRHAHRIELHTRRPVSAPRYRQPCTTLFLFGPTVREWGFHCPERGWVHWREFTAADRPGEIGAGCDA